MTIYKDQSRFILSEFIYLRITQINLNFNLNKIKGRKFRKQETSLIVVKLKNSLMTYQVQNNNFSSVNLVVGNLKNKNENPFDFGLEKAFINKEKQWLKSLKNNQVNATHNLINNSKTKPNSVNVFQQANNQQLEYKIQYSLAKTVKYPNLANKMPQQQNPIRQNFKPLCYKPESNSRYQARFAQKMKVQNKFQESNQSCHQKLRQPSDKLKQPSGKPAIMSIYQIQQMEKKLFYQKDIHKISSSASRIKLRTSTSKDSKDSTRVNKKSVPISLNAQKYNKYMKNQLVNVNIDLRKQMVNNFVTPHLRQGKIQYRQNMNPGVIGFRKIQDVSGFSQNTLKAQIKNAPLSSRLSCQKEAEYTKRTSNQPGTARDCLQQQNKNHDVIFKTRSKSNLSRYTQLKASNNQMSKNSDNDINPNQCHLNCEQDRQQFTGNHVTQKMPQKAQFSEYGSQKKTDKKIHRLVHSSAKGKFQINEQTLNIYKKHNNDFVTRTQKKQTTNNKDNQFMNRYSRDNKDPQNKQFHIQNKQFHIQNKQFHIQNKQFHIQNKQFHIQNKQFQTQKTIEKNYYKDISTGIDLNSLNRIIQQRIKKKPIRLTLQKKN